jgi:hypothetical protein
VRHFVHLQVLGFVRLFQPRQTDLGLLIRGIHIAGLILPIYTM